MKLKTFARRAAAAGAVLAALTLAALPALAAPKVQVSGKRLVVFNARCEYFYTANFNDVVGYLPLGNYCVVKQSTRKYNGYDWVIFRYQGTEYWTAVIGDRNRVEDCNCDCN